MPPLLFVMTVSMIKDCLEDRKRRQADDEENNSMGIRLKSIKGSSRELKEGMLDFEERVRWREMRTGDIVKVKKDEFFPADLIMIASSDTENQLAYVETKNLDGETNMKMKTVSKQVFA